MVFIELYYLKIWIVLNLCFILILINICDICLNLVRFFDVEKSTSYPEKSDVESVSYNLSAFENRHRSGHRSGHHKSNLYRHPSNSILVARHQKSTSYWNLRSTLLTVMSKIIYIVVIIVIDIVNQY